MEPFISGGDMIKEVYFDHAKWNELPWKFEAGTPNIAGAIALGKAVEYLENIGMENVEKHVKALVSYALEKLKKIKGIRIYGTLNPELRNGAISFNLADIHAHDLTSVLDEEGIAIRSGHACAMPLMQKLKVDAVARASFYIYNTFEDVDKLVNALEKAVKVFKI